MTDTPTLSERRTRRESTRVDPAYARSWQLVSARYADDFDAAQLGTADQIILDLEDAIDASLKEVARSQIAAWFGTGGRAWVRINDITTGDWEVDVTALAGLNGLIGVVLAKTEGAEQVTDTFQRLGGHTPVIPLIESALGIEEATAIARAHGSFRLAFGSGDYRKDTGTENTPLAMAYPRTRLVIASRLGGLPGPIDGPTVGAAVGSGRVLLRDQTAEAASLGMTGRLCLDLEQPAVINDAMAPTPADVAWAIGFLDAFEAGGQVIRDGSDKPRLARAEKIRARAELFAVRPAGV